MRLALLASTGLGDPTFSRSRRPPTKSGCHYSTQMRHRFPSVAKTCHQNGMGPSTFRLVTVWRGYFDAVIWVLRMGSRSTSAANSFVPPRRIPISEGVGGRRQGHNWMDGACV